MTTRKLAVAPELTDNGRSIDSIKRSAEADVEPAIPVTTLLLLSDGLGSGVAEEIVAVFVIEPLGALVDVLTDNVNKTVPSGSIAAAEQATVPPDPTAGVLQVKGPSDTFSDTKVVPDGSESLTVTVCAVEGPLLKTKME
jgi:hypothetical protein